MAKVTDADTMQLFSWLKALLTKKKEMVVREHGAHFASPRAFEQAPSDFALTMRCSMGHWLDSRGSAGHWHDYRGNSLHAEHAQAEAPWPCPSRRSLSERWMTARGSGPHRPAGPPPAAAARRSRAAAAGTPAASFRAPARHTLVSAALGTLRSPSALPAGQPQHHRKAPAP